LADSADISSLSWPAPEADGFAVFVGAATTWFDQDSPFGGDYRYRFFQTTAIQDVNDRWSATKSAFKTRNSHAALAIPTVESDLDANIATWIQDRPEKLKSIVRKKQQLRASKKPGDPFDHAALAWRIYYLGLHDVALDAAGPHEVARAFRVRSPSPH
jgi:hypothetical protein